MFSLELPLSPHYMATTISMANIWKLLGIVVLVSYVNSKSIKISTQIN